MLMKATELAAAISRAETARFNPSQLCNTDSMRIQVRLHLDFRQRSTDRDTVSILGLVYSGFNTAEVGKFRPTA